jgi:hypothetical protein
VQQFVICRVANPAFDRDGIVYVVVSIVSLYIDAMQLTFMKNVAHRTVVQDHDFAEIWLYLRKILDICAVAESAVLSVVSTSKVLALNF